MLQITESVAVELSFRVLKSAPVANSRHAAGEIHHGYHTAFENQWSGATLGHDRMAEYIRAERDWATSNP